MGCGVGRVQEVHIELEGLGGSDTVVMRWMIIWSDGGVGISGVLSGVLNGRRLNL